MKKTQRFIWKNVNDRPTQNICSFISFVTKQIRMRYILTNPHGLVY